MENFENYTTEDILEAFFATHLVFYTATNDPWDYESYLKSCVVGGELHPIQYIDGIFFVSNGISLHICGTLEDFKAFCLFVEWEYSPEPWEVEILLKDYDWLSEENIFDEREIIIFYHTYRTFYSIAPYYVFREYLKSKVPDGVLIIRNGEFIFTNGTMEYLVGLFGENVLFENWFKENSYQYYPLFGEPQLGDEDFQNYQDYLDILECINNHNDAEDE